MHGSVLYMLYCVISFHNVLLRRSHRNSRHEGSNADYGRRRFLVVQGKWRMMMPFVASTTKVTVDPTSDNLEEHEQRSETDLASFTQNTFFWDQTSVVHTATMFT